MNEIPLRNIQTCSRCIYDADIPNIQFNEHGACSYCELHDALNIQYPNKGRAASEKFDSLIATIKKSGRGRKYDCIIGVSGGCDSSYLIHKFAECGVRPLAVHFDNTWNSPIATQNIYNVLNKLGVDLFTYVVDSKEYDDIRRAFILAGVADFEAPTDIGFISALYLAAEKHGVKYLVEGHSFRTEGVSPLGWLYMDGKYIKSIHKKYGTRPMKTFPNMTLARFLRWCGIRGIKRVRPLYYLDYDKEATKKMLAETYGWEWYGGHHLENRLTAFYHSYFLPRRFNIDQRANGFAAMARSGQMTREEGLTLLKEPPVLDDEILDLVKKRLGFSDPEFEAVMTQPLKTWRDFPTYKRTFERLRPLFYFLVRIGRVPESFYVKFCFPFEEMGRATSQADGERNERDLPS